MTTKVVAEGFKNFPTKAALIRLFPNRDIVPLTILSNESKLCSKILPEAVEFLEGLDDKTREKIFYNMKKAQFVNNNELFKKLNNFIWEFRTTYHNKAYRLFSFRDKTDGHETLVVATHGSVKKKQKTPLKGIQKAEEIRAQYYKNKSNKN